MRLWGLVSASLLVACSGGGASPSPPFGDAPLLEELRVLPVSGAPALCDAPLPPSFACAAPRPKRGRSVCSDAALVEILECFGMEGNSKACAAARAADPVCAACVLDEWVAGNDVDTTACVLAIEPSGGCARALSCAGACGDAVCGTCDAMPGTGASDGSAREDCVARATADVTSTHDRGACLSLARDAACGDAPRFRACRVDTREDLLRFYRGACRDGGDWTHADEPRAD